MIDYLPEGDLSEAALRRVSFDKVRRYHVSIADLEARTSIDFGAVVREGDTYAGGEPREVRTLSEVLAGVFRPLPQTGVAASKAAPGAARNRVRPRK